VETRLGRASDAAEKTLLTRIKDELEKEKFASSLSFTEDEAKLMASYGLLTLKPVVTAKKEELEDKDALFARVLAESGYISFFTTGEKETRAWLIKKGATAWEASGAIHSDIQKGFIRAEIIALNDFLTLGGETPAKQAGKMRLEQKEYVMQDCDLSNFRFNK
jgi:ribosome-binding ATPase YchF (GTP1/OBG family)